MKKVLIITVICFLIQLTNNIQAQNKDSLQFKEVKSLTQWQTLHRDKLLLSAENILNELGYSYRKKEFKNHYVDSIPDVVISTIPYYTDKNKKAGELIFQLSKNKGYKNLLIWKEIKKQKMSGSSQKALFCSWSGWFNVGNPYCTLVLACPVIKKGTIQEQQNNCVKNGKIKNVMKRFRLNGCYCL